MKRNASGLGNTAGPPEQGKGISKPMAPAVLLSDPQARGTGVFLSVSAARPLHDDVGVSNPPDESANNITAKLLVKIPERFPRCRVWRVNVAGAVTPGGRLIRSGPKGLADISGIGPYGQRIEIEVKAGRDRMRSEQQSFRDMIIRHGGIHIIARDVEGTLGTLAQMLAARDREACDR